MAWDHCTVVIDGQECGQETCATVHMLPDDAGGHDFRD